MSAPSLKPICSRCAGAFARRALVPRGGRLLGEVEEYFIEMLSPGDTFVFAGEVLRYEAMARTRSMCRGRRRKIQSAVLRGRQVSAIDLSCRPRAQHHADHRLGTATGPGAQMARNPTLALTPAGPARTAGRNISRADKYYFVCYPFEGRLAHQTLGMLLTRRLERARLRPLGFVTNEYALAIWGLGDVASHIGTGELSLAGLFDADMLGDDLEAWLAESALMKRTFRTCAIIAG